MVTSIRRRANIEKQTGFIPDSELVEYLNYCLGDLYERLVRAGGQEWYRRTWPIITNSTDDTYPIPGDMLRLTSVDAIFATNIYLTCRPFMEEERNRYRWYPGWSYERPVWYRMLGNAIRFIPAPGGAYTIQLNGYPKFRKLVGKYTDATQDNLLESHASAENFEGINGWEEEAIWRGVIYCKQKGEEDFSFAAARVSELEQRISAIAETRDATGPERVHDVWSNYDQWGY
jgi:hypothetical protein